MKVKELIDKLEKENNLSLEELEYLLINITSEEKKYLFEKSLKIKEKYYDRDIYFRGLIEVSNICKCNCFYCGIRKDNKNVERYYLTEDEIIETARHGYELGYRTFVMQGGENLYFTDEKLVHIIETIKKEFPDVAITLSLGERSKESLEKLYRAGADRYLLRHETISKELYEKLHPNMSYENRLQTLKNLKEIGYQVGSGFLIGLPGLTIKDYAKDLVFLKELKPHMVGIGPFIPQKDTPLGECQGGTSEETILILGILRLLLPEVLLPATTALGTLDPKGREKAFNAGANVIMPNLTPMNSRKKYNLYDGKKILGSEAGEEKKIIEESIRKMGHNPNLKRGDNVKWKRV